jgi:hypothetical protein
MFYNIQFSFWYLFYAVVLTYLVWGFVVSFEVNLAMSGSHLAQKWIKKHHTYKQLYGEVKVFYPMIVLGYFFLELLPHYLFKAPSSGFDLDRLFEMLYDKK